MVNNKLMINEVVEFLENGTPSFINIKVASTIIGFDPVTVSNVILATDIRLPESDITRAWHVADYIHMQNIKANGCSKQEVNTLLYDLMKIVKS